MKTNIYRSECVAQVVNAAIVVWLLTGCCGTPNNYVMNQWSTTIRQMGITPVYPPREDVMVGDIYIYNEDPESPETTKRMKKGDLTIGINPRWHSLLGTIALLHSDYTNRPSWPATPTSYTGILTNASALWPQPNTGQTRIYTNELTPNRLRIVGFPEFIATTFTQGDLSALVPIEAVSVGLGLNGSDYDSVTLKIPSAESYSLPASTVLGLLFAKTDQLVDEIQHKRLIGSSKSNIWLRVITEVYYARALDIMLQSKSTFGGKAKAQVTGATSGAAAAPAASAGNENNGPQIIDPAASMSQTVSAVNSNLNQSGLLSVPNGQVQIVSASDRAISMRRIWEHGVAIGYRGLTLEVDPAGVVKNVKFISSQVPAIQLQ